LRPQFFNQNYKLQINMKRIYLLALCLLACVSVTNGQNHFPVQQFPANRTIPFTKSYLSQSRFAAKTNSAMDSTRWYNFGNAMAYDATTNYGDSSKLHGNNLFPDSTILVNYGSQGYAAPWIHNLGDVLDVSSSFFNDVGAYPGEVALTKTSIYNVDSLEFDCFYTRHHPDTTIVDTLVFELAVTNALQTGYFLL